MDLVYIAHETGAEGTGVNPLPEGWPAFDHSEPDAAIAEAKVASGRYAPVKSAGKASRRAEPVEGGDGP